MIEGRNESIYVPSLPLYPKEMHKSHLSDTKIRQDNIQKRTPNRPLITESAYLNLRPQN